MQNTSRALRLPRLRKGPRRALHEIQVRGQSLRIYQETEGRVVVESQRRQQPGALEAAALLDYLRAEGYLPEETSFLAGFSESSPAFAFRRAAEQFRRSDDLQACCAVAVAALSCLVAVAVAAFQLLAVAIR